MTKLKQIFADPLLGLSYLFVAVLPFLFWIDNEQSPFELPKYIFSVLGISLIFSCYVLRELREQEITLKWNLPLLLLAVILVVQTVSFAFSINPFVSFWGDYFLPADSWLSIVVFTALAALLVQFLDSFAKVRLLAQMIAVIAGVVAFHGGLQKAGLEVFPQWRYHDFSNGVYALQGQPVSFASILGMSAPLVLVFFITARSVSAQIGFGAIILLINSCILFSGSRAPVVTNIFTSLLILALLFWHRRSLNAAKKILVALALVIAAPLASYSTAGTEGLAQKLQADELSRGSSSRLLIWQNGFSAWQQNPLLGTGPETFSITQLALQSPQMNFTPYWNNYWAKAHNYIVHTLTSTGLLGLVSLLILILYVTFCFFDLFRKKSLSENQLLAAGFSAGFIFISIANLTAFNFVVTQMYGVIFPVATGLLLSNFEVRTFKVILHPRLKLLALVFLFLAVVPLSFRVVAFWRADMLYHQTIKLNGEKKLIESMTKVDEAIRLTPSNPMYYCLKTDILLYLLLKNRPQLRTHEINNTVTVMDETSKTCVELGINRFQYFNSRGMIFGNLFYDKVISSSQVAEEAYSQLKKMTPASPTPYYRMGLIYSVSNREAEFLQEMNKAIELKPDYYMAYKDLLLHAYSKKDQAEVEALVGRVLQTKVYTQDMFEYLKGLAIVARKNEDLVNFEKLKEFYETQRAAYR